MTFLSLGLNPTLSATVDRLGYQVPTDVQTKAIPGLLAGRDLLAIAETGSGKSAAFALPLLQLLADIKVERVRHRGLASPRALVLAPTRELAEQLALSFERYAQGLELKALAVYGGVNIRNQIRALELGVDVLVATPGRLWDLIVQFGLSLDEVRHLVLDEADRMLDMGFAPAIDKIRTRLGEHQSALFSASFAEKEQALARRWLKDPLIIETEGRGATPESLSLELCLLDRRRWAEWLAELVGKRNYQQCLVFVATRDGVDSLVRELKLDGISAGAFHGDKTQGARRRGLEEFKDNRVRLLVATDVAARGLDISQLPVVVSLGMPHSEEDLLHRLGRSARAGNSGHAIVVLERDDRAGLGLLGKLCPELPEPVTPVGYGPKDPLPERYREQSKTTGKPKSTPKHRQRGKQAAAQNSGKTKGQGFKGAGRNGAKGSDPRGQSRGRK